MNKLATLALAALLSGPAAAQGTPSGSHDAHHPSPSSAAPASGDYSDGEVRRVDRDAQKITLRHGPIPSLGMPDMTMVFRVSDAAMLDAIRPGDKVQFKADRVGGQYTVTELVVVR